MRRLLVAALSAALLVALYAGLIYGFLTYAWPYLPPWAAMLCFVALAVFVIGSPIFWLARMSRRVPVPEHLLKRRPPKDF